MTRSEAEVRSQKVEELQTQGIEPYPSQSFQRSHTTQQVQELFSQPENTLENGESDPQQRELRVCGRITSKRDSGKICFIDLTDFSGKIQLKIEKNLVIEENGLSFNQIKKLLDIGDFVGAVGIGCRTNRGELSVQVTELSVISKATIPFPDSYYGINDPETCRRHREMDLVSNAESFQRFQLRSRLIHSIRNYLVEKGFYEIETPTLQAIYGGAAARPFITHHNALDIDLYLRIAPELFLKRAICGGFERVFELGRIYRNEGIDSTHNPEFTGLEVYQAYADYFDIMTVVEEVVCNGVQAVFDKPCHSLKSMTGKQLRNLAAEYGIKGRSKMKKQQLIAAIQEVRLNQIKYQDHTISLERKYDYSEQYPTFTGTHWRVKTMVEAVRDETGLDFDTLTLPDAISKAEQLGIPLSNLNKQSLGYLLYAVFDRKVESTLIEPTFIIDFPVEVSPLAKQHRSKPGYVERFELFIAGTEFSNGFSELNDPKEQRKRFEEQLAQKNAGDDEAHPMDEDFIEALSLGMPNCAGMGIGIDRLVMLLTNTQSIRDVIMFPTMRSVKSEE